MGAITFWKQFKTVLWKNALSKRRNAGTLLLELLVPIGVMLGLWAIRSAIKFSTIPESVPKDYMWSSDIDGLYTNPWCTDENLVWSCVESGSNCISASTIPGDYPGCLLRRIGVAPRKEDEEDIAEVARNFVAWANNTYAAAHNASLFVYFDSEKDFLNYIGQNGYSLKDDIPVFSSAIIFDAGYPNWEYTIRINKTYSIGSDYYSSPQTRIDPVNNLVKTNDEAPSDDAGDDMQPYLEAYNTLGMFALSETINSYIATVTCQTTGNCGNDENVGVRVLGAANFPHEERKADQFWASLGSVFALLMIIALLYPLSNAIKTLVTEKETKLREQMLMMALRSDVLWLSWIIHFLALYVPLSVALMLASGSLFKYSDQIYVFLYFMAFFVSSLSYCVLISVVISKAKTAAIVGSVVFFAGYFIYVGLESANPSRSQLLLACLHPASAFTFGTLAFQEYEDAEIGVTEYTWDVSAKYNISFQDTLMMQFVDTLYLAFLAFYLSHVWPSEYGSSKPWYFPLQYSYWFRNCEKNNSKQRVTSSSRDSGAGHIEMPDMHSIIVEDVTEDLMGQAASNKCVQIKNLRKTFPTPTGEKVAVDNLNLTFYSGQITALLGHNGAGKSTTVSMLTGLITPESGTAIIEGYDISVDMQEARKSLGVCPQHDVLIPDMTVEEHLAFFANIKGCNAEELDVEITKMIESVGLVEKRREFAHNLSGGQKRKLSVAIAFIGNSRVVFLDEPTSGMDPYSRRFTWNVIRQHREGRVIVLTTHFMDEADLLGDRIAIMGDGKLRCVGSPLFLKTKYGVGYNMTIEKQNPITFNTKGVIDIINRYVEDAKILTNVGTELTVQLPLTSSHSFQPLFEQFDNNSESLGIQSYGMSVTTLEEVFIKVAEGNVIRPEEVSNRVQVQRPDVQQLTVATKSANSHDLVGEVLDEEYQGHKAVEFDKIDENDHLRIFLLHMEAMFQKRALYFTRDTKSWVLQYILPVIFVLAGMAVMYFAVFTRDQPSITLTIDDYNKGISSNQLPFPYSAGSYVCPSSDNGECSEWKMDISGQEVVMQEMVKASNLPLEPGQDIINVYNMSYYLQHNRDDFEASRYGAVTFVAIDNRDENVDNSTILNMEYIIHANFTGVHAGPLTSTLIADALVRTYHPSVSIVTNLHPLPETKFEKQRFRNFNLSNLVFFILLAIPYIPASFGAFVLKEKECKAKHQQLVSGVSVVSYWLATWIWDNLTYQITAWMIIILIIAFPDTEALSEGHPLGVTIGLFMLFGTAITGFTYLFCLRFKKAAGAQTAIISVIFVLGLLLEIAGIVLRIIPSTRDMYLNHLRIIFALSPAFALGDALNAMAVIDFLSAAELGGNQKYSPLDWDIAGLCLTMLAIESVAYISIFILIEYLSAIPSIQLYMSRYTAKKLPEQPNADKDEDIIAEEERVATGKANDSTILISQLKKMYSGGKYAVRGVSLGIPNGECFGLLGINGAGKTSLLSILSGEFPPTEGDVVLTGMNLFTEVHKCRRKIGYCPQFDALFDLLTAREHLTLYAKIKGIKPEHVSKVVEGKIHEMGLTEYADRIAGTFSGGNKRKLSVAMAMIGEPSIVFLDEPSTGMDPVARRFMWEVISDIVTKREKCSLILTTHSMEECEALCTRIGIMVGGLLKCLGSSQHLRERYGLGYQVEIGFEVPEADDVSAHASSIFQAAGKSDGDCSSDASLTREEVQHAFDNMGYSDWWSRVTPDGTGADIHAALTDTGCVYVKHLSSWCILERRYDLMLSFLEKNFENYVLRERQATKVRVEIPFYSTGGERRRLANMFGLMEKSKSTLRIREYSIAQTSLEQIFNSFASKQEEETAHAHGLM